MKERDDRLSAIKRLIKTQKIQNQDELQTLLQNEDFDVTQATLSRDLRYLKVSKILDEDGNSIYTFTSDEKNSESEQIYIQDFLRGYVSIDFSGNIIVIKTITGHANSVCNAIDNLYLPEIIGTVAGDNCIIAVMREDATKEEAIESLKRQIPDIEI